MACSRLDLPAPTAPTITTSSPLLTRRLTLRSTGGTSDATRVLQQKDASETWRACEEGCNGGGKVSTERGGWTVQWKMVRDAQGCRCDWRGAVGTVRGGDKITNTRLHTNTAPAGILPWRSARTHRLALPRGRRCDGRLVLLEVHEVLDALDGDVGVDDVDDLPREHRDGEAEEAEEGQGREGHVRREGHAHAGVGDEDGQGG